MANSGSNPAAMIEQITAARTLVVKRVSDGGMHISENGKTVATCLRSNAFETAIAGLVASDVNVAQVARIELRHVAPQLEFTVDGIEDYFNIAPHSTDNVQLGQREGLKGKRDVARSLTAHLTQN